MNNLTSNVELSKSERAQKITELQESMMEIRCDMPDAEHIFTPGIYARKFSMSAGMLVVGKKHKHEHLMIVLSGHSEIATDEGITEVFAGEVHISPPGAKRVVRAIDDTVFLTVHHNESDTQNLDEIECQHIEDGGFKIEYHNSIDKTITSEECAKCLGDS